MTASPDVVDYLARVRSALADLPAEERDELLADVEASLIEGSADTVEPIEQRLGPPEAFARELRVAAGLSPVATPRRARFGRLRDLRAHPRTVAARGIAGELRPVWWFARGYVAVVALCLFLGVPWSSTFVGIPDFISPLGGLLLVGGGVATSVAIGRRERDGLTTGRWVTAINLALVLAALPVAIQVSDGRSSLNVAEAYFSEPADHATVTNMGSDVANIYPYSRDGELLYDVLLYDSYGQPLRVGSADPSVDPSRRYLAATNGEPLLHSFPIRYFEPGTTRIAEPDAGPEIEVPEILTPPVPTPAPPRKAKRRKRG